VRDGLADHGAQGCNVREAYEASQRRKPHPNRLLRATGVRVT
jgi:hypothetical protein